MVYIFFKLLLTGNLKALTTTLQIFLYHYLIINYVL